MGFLQTLGQVGGGAAKTYFDNNLGQKWREQQIKAEISKAMGKKELDVGVDDPALWDSSLSPEQRSQLEAQTGGMGLSRVGNRAFANEYDAKTYADQYNSLSGQYGRAADVYNRFGETDKALGLQRDKQMLDNSEQAARLALAAEKRQEQLAAQQGEVFKRQQSDWAMKDAVSEGVKRAAGAGASVQALAGIDQNELLRSFGGDRAKMNAYLAEATGAGSTGNQARMIAQTAREAGDITTATTQDAAAADADTKSAAMAYDALRSGDVQKANILWNSRGTTGQLIVPAGKNKQGEPLYGVVDLRTRAVLGNPATPDELVMQHLPLEVRSKMAQQSAETRLALARANDPDLRTASGSGGANYSPLTMYTLQQQKSFDAARTKVLDDLDSGKITEAQATKQLNRLSLKFGGQSRAEAEAKPMSIKEKEEARALISERVRAENPKAGAEVINGLIQRELAASGLVAASANPYAALTNDSGTMPSRPAASATPQPGLKRADPNAAYMEKFEKWKAAKERYEHFSKKGDAAGMAHWKPIMDAYK